MDFAALLKEFTSAVEAKDGTRLAALFTEDGVYHDTFYGAFQGRAAIKAMLEERFWGDAKAFRWEAFDGVSDGTTGWCAWRFSYTSTMAGSDGRRVAANGMSRFRLRDGLIADYDEKFDSGMALEQLGFPPERIAKFLHRSNETALSDPALKAHLKG